MRKARERLAYNIPWSDETGGIQAARAHDLLQGFGVHGGGDHAQHVDTVRLQLDPQRLCKIEIESLRARVHRKSRLAAEPRAGAHQDQAPPAARQHPRSETVARLDQRHDVALYQLAPGLDRRVEEMGSGWIGAGIGDVKTDLTRGSG